MAEYDLVIRGGTIVDGRGLPRYKADLAVKDGRIAKISGRIPAGGAREIDASGCIVAPGAVDLHTHYDAQLNWDPYCSLSGWFGVTSLTIGQCGFGFAPTKPEDRELNMRMMNRVEAIPLESMRLGMRWDWETFPEYLDSLDRQGLGLNVGALFPCSPLRAYIMGMLPARERTSATEKELNMMKSLFHDAMKAGAFGFSANKSAEDRPDDGGYLPTHIASDAEFLALAEVLGEFGVGHIGWTIGYPIFDDRTAQYDLVTEMVRVSGRPAHINCISPTPQDEAWVASARAEGLPLVIQQPTIFPDAIFKLTEYNLFDVYPNWIQPLVGGREERMVKLRDPETRAAMKRDLEVQGSLTNRTDWNRFYVMEAAHERNRQYEGKTIAEIAAELAKHPVDAFIDLALDEDLETEFIANAGAGDRDDDELARLILNPFSHISLSDGGAHTRFLTVSTWPVNFLSTWIRDKEIMTLEEAHVKISAYPAWFADFKDRGTLQLGAWADIIVYDLDTLGFLHPKPVFGFDFPGGERRIIQKATGLRYTIVNGAVTFEEAECTGALPGKLLRSYDMVA